MWAHVGKCLCATYSLIIIVHCVYAIVCLCLCLCISISFSHYHMLRTKFMDNGLAVSKYYGHSVLLWRCEEKTNKILHTLIHMSMSASDKNYGEDILHFCHLPGLLSPLLSLSFTLSLPPFIAPICIMLLPIPPSGSFFSRRPQNVWCAFCTLFMKWKSACKTLAQHICRKMVTFKLKMCAGSSDRLFI